MTRQFRVLIRRRNRPRQSDSENGIRPGQSDSETRQRMHERSRKNQAASARESASVRASVCDHWTQKKVTGKRKVTMDTEKSDGKKKSDDGHREKWREKDKTTVGWRAFEVLRARSWNLALRAWNPGPESQVLKPRVEVLKPRSWYPGPETSRWDPETQVLRAKYRGLETQVLRACVR